MLVSKVILYSGIFGKVLVDGALWNATLEGRMTVSGVGVSGVMKYCVGLIFAEIPCEVTLSVLGLSLGLAVAMRLLNLS